MKKFRFPKHGKKAAAIALCGVMAAGVTVGAFALFGEREAATELVSAGVQHFADDAYLACSAPVGQNVSFTSAWFDTTLQGGAVSAITVTSLPPVTEGKLFLGHSEVTVGQVIARETLSFLSFTPNEGIRQSSFEFIPATESGNSGYTLRCMLSVTDTVNCCPAGTKSITAVSTHESLTLTGTLTAEDPEGERLCYEILNYPDHGTLMLDAGSGNFSYTPDEDFVGEDTFTWRAQDIHGAFSEPALTEITVREITTGYLFADVDHTNLQSAALRVTEKGLMGGEAMGGRHYFHPERSLTRAAFVAILMDAADIECPEATDTGYADDAQIPMGMKGAIKYAKEQGWLGDAESFRPSDPITRAEAAKIAAAVLNLSAPGYSEAVEDFQDIPVDAADALYAIYEGGYISTLSDGTLAPLGELSRGDAAKFFSKILDGKSAE